jgi:hypothetical protein
MAAGKPARAADVPDRADRPVRVPHWNRVSGAPLPQSGACWSSAGRYGRTPIRARKRMSLMEPSGNRSRYSPGQSAAGMTCNRPQMAAGASSALWVTARAARAGGKPQPARAETQKGSSGSGSGSCSILILRASRVALGSSCCETQMSPPGARANNTGPTHSSSGLKSRMP